MGKNEKIESKNELALKGKKGGQRGEEIFPKASKSTLFA